MKIKNLPTITIDDCYSYTDVAKKLDIPFNGWGLKKSKKYVEDNNLSTSHFQLNIKNIKYPITEKECPVCKSMFKTRLGANDEKTVCSKTCSNKYFRSGENHPNYKNGSSMYRSKMNISSCERCGYNEHPEILQVHHIDRDRKNSELNNLIVLCPNCHCLDHYLNKDGMYSFRG